MSSANESAFPCQPLGSDGLPSFPAECGLTKREYFALHLMSAIRSQVNPENGDDCYTREYAAKAAVGDADALLEELTRAR